MVGLTGFEPAILDLHVIVFYPGCWIYPYCLEVSLLNWLLSNRLYLIGLLQIALSFRLKALASLPT